MLFPLLSNQHLSLRFVWFLVLSRYTLLGRSLFKFHSHFIFFNDAGKSVVYQSPQCFKYGVIAKWSYNMSHGNSPKSGSMLWVNYILNSLWVKSRTTKTVRQKQP